MREIKAMTPFQILVDKVAVRLAQGKKPHTKTLNKMYNYPGITAETRMKMLDERYKYFRERHLQQQKEMEEMFARAMKGTMWETVGEPTTHNIKFVK